MADATARAAWISYFCPFCRGLNAELAELLLRMQADDEVQVRYEDLRERNTDGRLSPVELDELTLLVRANVLKAEARTFLQHRNAA